MKRPKKHKVRADGLAETTLVTPAPQPYATSYHAPVLYKPIVAGLIHRADGLYVDGTLGGGGHSAAFLDALSENGRVIGLDQDDEALREAQARLGKDARFRAVKSNFGDLQKCLAEIGVEEIDGLLLDLGVSSHQLDAGRRGFSFQADAALDMRMNPSEGMSAAAFLNSADEYEIRRVLKAYGEEPRAAQIARRIVQSRPLDTTQDLANVVTTVVWGPEQHKTLARVFQGIRIAINQELEVLEQVLVQALTVLKLGGRIAVLSYHSLEDRRVKRFLKFGNFEGEAEKDFFGAPLTPWKLLTPKAIEADSSEVVANPRARSAKLRIAEKL